MGETEKRTEMKEGLNRQELFALHAHYESVVKDMLDFCYQYLNFYTGFLTAILAATLTGLLSIKHGDLRALALLLGPLLTIVFARIGYSNVTVFYRRYIEAWVVTVNLEAMLGIRYAESIEMGAYTPAYVSGSGGFLPVIERAPIKKILDTAKSEKWDAEKVVREVAKTGDTLANARNTFLSFGLIGFILSAFIGLSVVF